MRNHILKIAALLTLFSAPAWSSDLAGDWTLNMTGPQGEETFVISIKVDGNQFEVTGEHPILGPSEGKGTLEGDTVRMSLQATGEEKVEFIFEGTLAGNRMSGHREINMLSPRRGGQGGPSPEAGGQMPAPENRASGGGGAMGGNIPSEWTAVRK